MGTFYSNRLQHYKWLEIKSILNINPYAFEKIWLYPIEWPYHYSEERFIISPINFPTYTFTPMFPVQGNKVRVPHYPELW